jgi:hypothetical protein
MKPVYDEKARRESFDLTLSLLPENPLIVEYGMTRLNNNWNGDGNSTILFAWYVSEYGGKFISVDIEPTYIPVAHSIIKSFDIATDSIYLVCGDASNFMDVFDLYNIDLMYLDAWDWTKEGCDAETSHMKVFLKIENRLSENALILLDDVLDINTYKGKGKQLIPYMLSNNYELLFTGYQFLFRKI